MTPDTLTRLGTLLFCPYGWRKHMAEWLEINPRTVERWASGDTIIPEWLPKEMLRLAKERKKELDGVVRNLEGQ